MFSNFKKRLGAHGYCRDGRTRSGAFRVACFGSSSDYCRCARFRGKPFGLPGVGEHWCCWVH